MDDLVGLILIVDRRRRRALADLQHRPHRARVRAPGGVLLRPAAGRARARASCSSSRSCSRRSRSTSASASSRCRSRPASRRTTRRSTSTSSSTRRSSSRRSTVTAVTDFTGAVAGPGGDHAARRHRRHPARRRAGQARGDQPHPARQARRGDRALGREDHERRDPRDRAAARHPGGDEPPDVAPSATGAR